jgi:hypothetical protein
MIGTFQNAGMLVSMAVFFSILTVGLAARLPGVMYQGLTTNGLPAVLSRGISHLPPIGVLFAAFLGYNPMRSLVPGPVAAHLSPHAQAVLFGKTFFPHLIMPAFMSGLHDVFHVSAALALIAAVASLLRGQRYIHGQERMAAAVRAASVVPKGGGHATALRPEHNGHIPIHEVAASRADDGRTDRGASGRSE